MKRRLYYTSAYYEINTVGNTAILKLISYSTKICEIKVELMPYLPNVYIKLWRYPTATSQQHIRKFAKMLHESKDFGFAGRLLDDVKDYLVEKRLNYGGYDNTKFFGYNASAKTLKNNGFQYGYSDLNSFSY